MRQYTRSSGRLVGLAVVLSVWVLSGHSEASPTERTPKPGTMDTAAAVRPTERNHGGEIQMAQQPKPSEFDAAPQSTGDREFVIREFDVEGNTLLSKERVAEVLAKHKGDKKTIKDIDKVRLDLERAYHSLGYPTVIVVVPEQTVESGTIRLEIVEGRLGSVLVTGNKYYSRYNILGKLPSLKIGKMLYEPTFVKELDALNANPDLKVAPLLKPGTEPGLVNMELRAKERMPFHIKLQADNQGPLTTPRNRLVMDAQYTNLWDMDHILNVQTVQTPEDWGAVQTYGMSYVAPLQWPNHLLSVYASKTSSTSALSAGSLGVGGGEVSIAGNATVAGFRYSFPIYSSPKAVHQFSLGADFKRLEKTEATFPSGLGTAVVLSPIQYTPLSVAYNAFLGDDWGATKLSATAKGYAAIVPGGRKADFTGDPNDPFNKPGVRAGSTGNFAVVQGSIERLHDLPLGMNLLLHAAGQWASEPLVVTEQYFAGGLDTVRGYFQFESLGDHAIRGRAELTTPELWPIPIDRFWQRRRSSDWEIKWRLASFYDAANLWISKPLPSQQDQFRLESVGWGLRVRMPKDVGTIRIDQGYALQDATATKRGDTFVHFLVTVVF